MPKRDTREYRSMRPLAVMRGEGEENAWKVRGYASTFNEPYMIYEDMDGENVMEVIAPTAFDEADMTDVIMQFDHEGMVYARTRNSSLVVGADDHGLWMEAYLGATEASRDLYRAIETGLVDRMSFSFTIADESYDKKSKTWTISRIGKVFDVSAVSIPANPGTEISAARKRRLDGVIQAEQAERLAKERRREKIKILLLKTRIAASK